MHITTVALYASTAYAACTYQYSRCGFVFIINCYALYSPTDAVPASIHQLVAAMVVRGAGARPTVGAVLSNAVFHATEVSALRTVGERLCNVMYVMYAYYFGLQYASVAATVFSACV
jgi:hypothetical protein